MDKAQFELERKADDAWTFPKLAVLAVVTLTVALSVIWYLGYLASPYK